MDSEQVILSLQDATEVAKWVLEHREATVADVMAEFDMTDDEAFTALAAASAVIRCLREQEGEGRE